MSEKVPILYGFFKSSAVYRVRIALAWKQVEHKTEYIDLYKSEQRGDVYRKIVPTEKVPAFITKDGKLLSQSMAILEYLEEVYPEKPLLPKDVYQRALAREIAQIVACDVHPLQNEVILNMAVGTDRVKHTDFAREIVTKTFAGLEGRIKETSGKYSVGDSVTVADVLVLPMVVNAFFYGVDMTKFPTLTRIHNTLMEVPEFKNAHPFNQEDCPAELRSK